MAGAEEWSYDERLALARVVAELPEDEGPDIYRIVVEMDPDCIEELEDEPDDVYVLFHLLQPETLEELENYVASRNVCCAQSSPEPDSESEESTPESDLGGQESSAEADLESQESSAKPDLESEECSAKPMPSSKKGPKSDDDEEKGKSIKTRLRRSSRKSEDGSSKQK